MFEYRFVFDDYVSLITYGNIQMSVNLSLLGSLENSYFCNNYVKQHDTKGILMLLNSEESG